MTDPATFASEPDQLSLFGAGEAGMQPPVRGFVADTELVRRRLQGLLETARRAAVMPWPERDARMWQTVFPQMADWLPDEEADQLRFAFMQEIRLIDASEAVQAAPPPQHARQAPRMRADAARARPRTSRPSGAAR